MFDELPVVGIAQAANPADKMPEMPIAAVEAPSPPPSPEQTRVADAVFAAQERESETVAGMLSMWTGVMLLHDVAVETFSKSAGEEDEGKKSLEVRRRPEQV